MNAALIRSDHVVRAWRDLGPMLVRAQLPDRPNAREAVWAGNAQLWAVLDHYEPIGAVVTQIKGERCLMWQIAGKRMREWAALVVDAVEDWARAMGCVALYGIGRKGWARIVEPMGFHRIADVNGRPAWERKIEGGHHG